MGSRPDRAFRIADARHAVFDGTGASVTGARWNSPGRRVIYAADSFAAAMLELLVHTRTGKVPTSHKWVEVAISKAVSVEIAEPEAIPNWAAEDSEAAREFGDAWFDSRRSLILVVPSVVTNGLSRNVLINQEHAELAELRVSEPREVAWDVRLFE
jgi:RES domain-containing protein